MNDTLDIIDFAALSEEAVKLAQREENVKRFAAWASFKRAKALKNEV